MQATREKGYKGLPLTGFLARWYARNTGKHIESYRVRPGRSPVDCRAASWRARGRARPRVFRGGPGEALGPYRIIGLDISPSFVAHGRRECTEGGRRCASSDLGNASSMPFDPDSFDFIYCRAAFKNFSEPIRAIDEMYRVLKPGGTAAIVDLRKDATAGKIDAAVAEMGLGRIDSALTKLIFKHSLLKRAYSQDDFRSMVSKTPFGMCEIKVDSIGLEVSLHK